MRILKHISDLAVKPQLGTLPVIHAVYQYPSFRRFKETPRQIHQCGFACARLSHNRHIHTRRHVKIKMLQNIFFSVRIHERNVFKHDISPDLLPVLFLRVKRVPVFLNDFLFIHHIRFLLQQIHYPFDIRLTGYQIR